MVGCHHGLNGHEFEQTVRDSEKQGKPGMLQCVGSQRSRHNLKDSTTTAISSGDMALREIQRLP